MSAEQDFLPNNQPPPESMAAAEPLPPSEPAAATQIQMWHAEGRRLVKVGEFEAAIAQYDQALELKPNSYCLWHERGLALRQLKRYEGAIANFDLALQIQPEYLPASRSRLFTLLVSHQLTPKLITASSGSRQKLFNDLQNLLTAFVKQKLPTLVALALVSYATTPNRATHWAVAGCFLLVVAISDLIAESQR